MYHNYYILLIAMLMKAAPCFSQGLKIVDKLQFAPYVGTSLTYTKVTDIDQSYGHENGGLTYIDNKTVVTNPEYSLSTIRLFEVNLDIVSGMHIPIYRSQKWSTGLDLNTGLRSITEFNYELGPQEYFALIAPQYAYIKFKKISYFIGGTFSTRKYRYSAFVIGATFGKHIRIYGTPWGRTYYTELSNGTLEPVLRFFEVGGCFVLPL